jgi:hypothetical protein
MEAPPDPGSKFVPDPPPEKGAEAPRRTVKGPGGRPMTPGARSPRLDRQARRFLLLALGLIGLGSATTLLIPPPAPEATWEAWRPGWWIRPLALNRAAGLTTLPPADIHDLYLTRADTLLAAAEDGLILRQARAETAWTLHELPGIDEAVAGFFDRGGAAVGAFTKSGSLWISDDDGRSWAEVPETLPPGTPPPLIPTRFEALPGVEEKAAPPSLSLYDVAPNTAQEVIREPTSLSVALRQSDSTDPSEGAALAALLAYGEREFLALTRAGRILRSTDGGADWAAAGGGGQGLAERILPASRPAPPPVLDGFSPLLFHRRAETLWTLGPVNSDYRGAFGSDTAVVGYRIDGHLTALPGPALRRLCAAPDGTLWGFDAEGALYREVSGEGTWEEVLNESLRLGPLRALVADSTGEGLYLAGPEGRVWALDGTTGEARALSRNALPEAVAGFRVHLPPPLFLVAALGLVLSSRRLLRRDAAPTEVEDIAEIFVSDRPLRQSDVDYLNFGPYVRGLSGYLRNASTQPPLTVAITGAWGSGKTSMMSLLKEDLEGRGFCPVWFNAWHHQRDEGLLAALLENVKTQAVPDPANRQGLHYRWRLLLRRARERRVRTGVSLLTFLAGAAGFGVLLFDPTFPVLAAIDTFARELVQVDEKGVFGYLADVLTVVSGGALLAPLLYVAHILRSFGVKPSALLAKPEGQATRRQLDEKAGFRHRFAREFAEVAESLRPLSLVIMIDDLDRCEPRAVFEILEAINFLSSSGKCFIVLGMDEERVQDCVAANCREMGIVPPRFHNGADAVSSEEAKYRDALEFANAYMEKMIQVRIAVPRADAEAAARLVAGDPGSPFAEGIRDARTPPWVQPLGVAAALLGAIVVGLGGANFIKHSYTRSLASASPITTDREATPPAPAAVSASEDAPAATPGPRLASSLASESAAAAWFSPWRDRVLPDKTLLPGRTLDLALGGILLLGLGIGGAAYPRLLTPAREVVVRDTPEFVSAARHWAPLVFARNPTPRNLKAFLNRVRYYAMLLRGEFADSGQIPEGVESSLVAFAAVEHVIPGWFRLSESDLGRAFGRGEETIDRLFQKEIGRLHHDPILHRHRALFERLSRHVRM